MVASGKEGNPDCHGRSLPSHWDWCTRWLPRGDSTGVNAEEWERIVRHRGSRKQRDLQRPREERERWGELDQGSFGVTGREWKVRGMEGDGGRVGSSMETPWGLKEQDIILVSGEPWKGFIQEINKILYFRLSSLRRYLATIHSSANFTPENLWRFRPRWK